MEPDDMQSPSVDEVLSLGIAELHWPGAEDAEERHEATVASRAVYHLEDIGSLGNTRLNRYTETRDEADLLAAYNIALSLSSQALSPLTTDTSTLDSFLERLHSTFRQCAESTRHTLPVLEYSANVSHLSLLLCPAENDTRAGYLEERVLGLEQLFRDCEESALETIMEAIIFRRRLLALAHSDDERSERRNRLASLLWKYWKLNAENVDILREEIGLRRDILQAFGGSDPERAKACGSLAISLTALYNSVGDLSILEEVLKLEKEVLRLRPEGHPRYAGACGNLAVTLWNLFNQNGDVALLDEALELEREVVRLQPEGHPDRADSCSNLAVSLRTRFRQTGDVMVLDEALNLDREAMRLRPAGDPDRADSCTALALSLSSRFDQTGDATLLDEVIELEREALRLRPTGHMDRAKSCGNLAISLWKRFNDAGDAALLDEVLELEREVLRLRPSGHPKRADSCSNLAVSLRTVFDRTGDVMMLNEALELDREAISLRPEGHPDRADSCAGLALSLFKRFEQTGDTALLNEVLELQREVLRLRPIAHLDRAQACVNLAVSLWRHFNQSGDATLLDEALELEREVLRLRPEGHPSRANACHNLAVSLRTRFKQTGDIVLLNEALELDREALSLRPEGHAERADSCEEMALSLSDRFKQTGDSALLNEVLDLEREVLFLRPIGHPDRAKACGNLAVSLWHSFDETGNVTLLDEALELEREVLHLRPEGHPSRADACNNLAVSLRARSNLSGDTVLLNEALELDREALCLRPEGHPDRADSCSSLAVSMRALFHDTKDESMLSMSIELDREALRHRPEGHPARALSCANLAVALWIQFNQTGDTALLDEAVHLERETLRLRPKGDPRHAKSCGNLAISLRTYFNHTDNMALLEEARSLFTQAIQEPLISSYNYVRLRADLARIIALPSYRFYDASAAVSLLSDAVKYRAGLIENIPSVCDALHLCAPATLSRENIVMLLGVYQAVIEVLPECGSVVLDKALRLKQWRSTGNLPLEALLLSLSIGNLSLGLELSEQGRAVLWSQTLGMQDPQLQELPDEWNTQVQTLLQSISSFVEHPDARKADLTARDEAHGSYNRLQQLLKNIRASPGLEGFMRGLSYSELAQVASAHPVIILAADDRSCHALVMSGASALLSHLVLDSIEISELEHLGRDIRGLDLNVRAMSGPATFTEGRAMGISPRRKLESAVQELYEALKKLWIFMVKPIIDFLGLKRASGKNRPRIHWCPIGSLVFLPIHAAGVYGEGVLDCCSDYVVSSYTPTLSALHRARADLVPRARRSLTLLAAAAPTSTTSLKLPFLYNVGPEVAEIAELARATAHIEVLEYGCTSAATVREVAQALPLSDIVHLACHGIQDQEDPLQSGFCLGDGRLTVSELMDIKLDHAFLAFLSACETAKGDKSQPDQAIHLAAAMLFCGFRSVIATMWSISDSDGPAVAREFYESLLAEEVIDADAVAYALDEAISKLRGKDLSPLRWASFIHVGA